MILEIPLHAHIISELYLELNSVMIGEE